jgi:hypothetical protein
MTLLPTAIDLIILGALPLVADITIFFILEIFSPEKIFVLSTKAGGHGLNL